MAELTGTEARKTWESAAPGWVEWENVLADGLRDATVALVVGPTPWSNNPGVVLIPRPVTN